MPTRSTSISWRTTEVRLVFGCLPDSRARARLQTALRGNATLRWFGSFSEMCHALEGGGRPTAVVVALFDDAGASVLDFARDVRDGMTGTPVVAYTEVGGERRTPMMALAEAGVHDVLFCGLNDEGYGALDVVFGAALGAAADVVERALRPLIPLALLPFVEAAARRPRDLQRVADVAAAIHMPRQSIGRWSRQHQYLRPEELLVWVRLLLVSVLFETTSRTVESIAADLHYGSATALRNRIREYTGVPASEIRDGGLELMMAAFRRRIEGVRAESQHDVADTKAG